MSSLQSYLQNALAIDNQESNENMNYMANQSQLDAMGKEVQEQAIGQLPFSIAEVSRGISGLYTTLKQGKDLLERKGGISDLMDSLGKESAEPFDIGKLASKMAGAGGEKLAAKFGPEAKQYGLDLDAILKASKEGKGAEGALAEVKSQLGAMADKQVAAISSNVNEGIDKFSKVVEGKTAELQQMAQEYTNKGLEELKSIHSKFGETLKSYSPAELEKLSESAKGEFKQLRALVEAGDASPEGLAKLKVGTEIFTKHVGLEKEMGRLAKAKEVLTQKAAETRAAVQNKLQQLGEEHEVKLGAADEALSRLKTQKETSENIIKEASARLNTNAENVFKSAPTLEDAGTVSSYRSGGSVNISKQVKQSQTAVDEALIAKHQELAAGLEGKISNFEKGKQQMIEEFHGTIERETAPLKQRLSEITPNLEAASKEISDVGENMASLGSRAMGFFGEALNIAGAAPVIASLAEGQVKGANQITSAATQLTASGKTAVGAGQAGYEQLKQKFGFGEKPKPAVGEAAAPKPVGEGEAPKPVGEISEAPKPIVEGEAVIEKAAEETAVKAGGEATALATEGAVAAGSSVIPLIGEGIDVALGIAMGVQSLVDIFGGSHQAQAPPPPPSQVVQYTHQEGIY